jgi:FtsP/CotA-like multicopper oxidase with cupredoxin domain
VRHRPDYFLINGRDGGNTLTDPTTAITAPAGEKVLIRATNVGYQPAQIRLGGLEFEVIASDGRPLRATILATQQLVTPGERYDILLTMPSDTSGAATVDYLDIRLNEILGTASTSLQSAPGTIIFQDGFESGDSSAWS